MYLPFLRGKQFELIALRELNGLAQSSQKISPVIEPVKKSFSTLNRTIEKLKNYEVNFTIIVNPQVGEVINEYQSIISAIEQSTNEYSNFQIGIYCNSERGVRKYYEKILDIPFDFGGFTLIHNGVIKDFGLFDEFEAFKPINFHLVNSSKTSRRYYRHFSTDTRVILDDFFISQKKNVDYSNTIDEFFSEEHLYYREDGYKGFSDYLTIGESYSDAGFLPYAVAIHLTYPDAGNRIRIRHFVSDSNDDNSDIAGKFAEALGKLIIWLDSNRIPDTKGIREFRILHSSGHFPGLGVIKKLSVMHHIELVSSLI